MLHPKCIGCGKFLADIQLDYELSKNNIESDKKLDIEEKREKMKEILNNLYIKRWCCRMQVITYCKLIDIII